MASASRNNRRKRHIKRTNSLLKRALKLEQSQRYNTALVLLAVLAQNGGEITVTQGTLNQVTENTHNLGFHVVASKIDGEFLVQMVVKQEEDTHVDTNGDIDGNIAEVVVNPTSESAGMPESMPTNSESGNLG